MRCAQFPAQVSRRRLLLAALLKPEHICQQGVTARREGALLETLESMERCSTSLAARADNDSDDVIDSLKTSCQRDPVTRK